MPDLDVTLRLGTVEISISKKRLFAINPKFQRMFQWDMIESRTHVVDLLAPEGIAEDVSRAFLEYLIHEEIEINSDNLVWLLLLARDQEISSLFDLCMNYIKENIDEEKAWRKCRGYLQEMTN